MICYAGSAPFARMSLLLCSRRMSRVPPRGPAIPSCVFFKTPLGGVRISRPCVSRGGIRVPVPRVAVDLVQQCILSGADAYLLKPLRVHELTNIWQYVWRRRHEL